MSEYIKIGRIVATFGVKGELVLKHSLGKKTQLKGVEALFIEEKKNSFLPYFIEKVTIRNEEELLIQFEGITTKEKAFIIAQKDVWMQKESFNKQVDKSAPISFLGYKMYANDELLGEVIEVIEQPHQILCSVMVNEKEVLIPVHEHSLENIDKRNKKIYVDIPEGLLDIYQ